MISLFQLLHEKKYIDDMGFLAAVMSFLMLAHGFVSVINPVIMLQSYSGQEDLYCVYVPTNHLYIGDIFMVNSKDVIRPNLSVREGIGKFLLSVISAQFDILLQETWMATPAKKDLIYLHAWFAEIVVSGGMSMPQILSTLDPQMILGDRTGPSRS